MRDSEFIDHVSILAKQLYVQAMGTSIANSLNPDPEKISQECIAAAQEFVSTIRAYKSLNGG